MNNRIKLSPILARITLLGVEFHLFTPQNLLSAESPDQSYRSLSIRINHAALEIIYLKDVYKLNKARESEKPVNTIISRDYVITEKASKVT